MPDHPHPPRALGPVCVETLGKIPEYSRHQLEFAVRFAYALGRGKLILCEHPDRRER